MCGFIGGVTKKPMSDRNIYTALASISHRGPDHQGAITEIIHDHHVTLGHTRLSIIDLSSHALQPFESSCGRYALIFNGEIYNYKELRDELLEEGYEFRTESDTEVLLNALVAWREGCLRRLIGMFSFVFLDRIEKNIILVRDAFGIKPFYYSYEQGELYFASELSALLNLKGEVATPNLQCAYDYLVHGDYDSCVETFVDGVSHLPPGHFFTFDLVDCTATSPKRWWWPDLTTTTDVTFDRAVEKVRELFLDSIRLHLRSDVPVGITLSGGIDSSSVVCAVRYLEPELPIHTFSYVADDVSISEEAWIDQINEQMNAHEHKVLANEQEMQNDLDAMLSKQGEPFGSTSIYAQYRVFKLVKECGVTVTLDGQGADELLAGYSGYPGHRLLSLIESEGWLAAHRYAKRWANSPGRSYVMAWKYFVKLKLPDTFYEIVRKMIGRDFKPAWLNTALLVDNGVVFKEKRAPLMPENKGQRVREALASALMHRGLPSLLRHGDRNSMAFSIESRVPFLTLPLAEFLLSLPEHYLISEDGVTKHIFREAMRGIVPDSHLDRKDKIGFATPERIWLFNMQETIQRWISDSPEIDFINKAELLKEFDLVVEGKLPFDGRIWRWVNYLRWYSAVIK